MKATIAMTKPDHHSASRHQSAATASQGRGARAPTAASAASLDATHSSGAYTDESRSSSRQAIDLSRVRRLVPLASLLARYDMLADLKSCGRQLRGCCSLHHGTSKTELVVDLAAGSWYCFGCKRGGGTIELVMAREGVTLIDAAHLIAHWFALAEPGQGVPSPRKHRSNAMASKPTHKVLAVSERTDADNTTKTFFTRIGAAWPIKSGAGLSISLDALPINGRLIVLEFDAEDDEAGAKPTRETTK